MSKVLILAIIGFLVVTEIFARSTDNKSSCGKHGDPCSQGCCSGFKCSANMCQTTTTTVDVMKQRDNKLKPIHNTHKNTECGKHGDSCTYGCCDGFTCNPAAKRCMVIITQEMLKEARAKLKPVSPRAIGA